MSYDALIVGSGFGGSVAALRLAERGYRVKVLEQGRRIGPAEMEAGATRLRDLLWAPRLGCHGYFTQQVLRHLTVVGGVGLGGGSLVYAGVLIQPRDSLFRSSAWARCGVDWARELSPHYETAARMLGRAECTFFGEQDRALKATAEAMGAADSFGPVPLGIYFGEPGVDGGDPYFDGAGPARTGCRFCGGCMIVGCRHGSKNSLDKNYLHLAEAAGAEIATEHRAVEIRPVGGGYAVRCQHPRSRAALGELHARRVVVAAGVLGTVKLLARSRANGALPAISKRLGADVRSNSEAIVGVLADDPDAQLDRGTGISTHFYLGDTHITNNRFSAGQAALRLQMSPMIDDSRPVRRALRTAWSMLARPDRMWKLWRASNWHGRLTILTVMQQRESRLALRLRRRLGREYLATEATESPPPSFIPEANQAARIYAREIGGTPFSSLLESITGTSVTAHILGGCVAGRSAADSVIAADHQVHGYPGLYVLDASAIPGNMGVNPALTITAMAERAMAQVPAVG